MAQVEEPLLESAPLARELAARLCSRDPATGESCSWFHGLWQYLRLLRLVATPEHHVDFYREALATLQRDTAAPRVLIAGAADYSMLAHVLALLRARSIEPDLTVSDLCETPLALSRWYAERSACRIDTRRCDMLRYPDEPPFDAICTHSFLGYFSAAERPQLVARWRQMLRRGGRVITVKRVRPGRGTETTGFTEDQAQAFEARVLAAAEGMRGTLAVDPAVLAAEAGKYARSRRTWPIRSEEEIRELFERSGFAVERLACAPVGGPQPAARGPTMLGGADYVQIVATRL